MRSVLAVVFMMKTILCVFSAFLLISCAQKTEQSTQLQSSGIVAKPEKTEELRPGEKVNMMMLMSAEELAGEMDEVIVIPPKDKKTVPQ